MRIDHILRILVRKCMRFIHEFFKFDENVLVFIIKKYANPPLSFKTSLQIKFKQI